jgi:hypothetical protein
LNSVMNWSRTSLINELAFDCKLIQLSVAMILCHDIWPLLFIASLFSF